MYDIGNNNSETVTDVEAINLDEWKSRKYDCLDEIDVRVGTVSGVRSKERGPVIRPVLQYVRYALHLHCLEFELCKECVGTI